MRDSPWYIVFLLVLIGGVMGYVYFGSELRTIKVTDKYVEQGRSKYGFSSAGYVLETDRGKLKILKFPIIGYAFDAEDVYNRISPGSSIEVRIGRWPPDFLGAYSKPHVMAVY